MKLSSATHSSVGVVVNSTATSKSCSYVMDVALATNELAWIIIFVATATGAFFDGIDISCTTNVGLGIVRTRTTSGC